MATFGTFAEVITTDSLGWQAYVAGIQKKLPGTPLKEILKRTGGVYENKLEMPATFRKQVRDVAGLTNDQDLMKIAELPEVVISLEHFRHTDPETRIDLGYFLTLTPEEIERLDANRYVPHDPKKTLAVKLDPAHPWRVMQS